MPQALSHKLRTEEVSGMQIKDMVETPWLYVIAIYSSR